MADVCSMIPALPIGAAMKEMKIPGASPPTITAPPGHGPSRCSAKRWRAPGISHRRRSQPPRRTSAAWTACWRQVALGRCRKSWTGMLLTLSAGATPRLGPQRKPSGYGRFWKGFLRGPGERLAVFRRVFPLGIDFWFELATADKFLKIAD